MAELKRWYKCTECGYTCQSFNLACNDTHYNMGFKEGDKICLNCGVATIELEVIE